MALLAFAEALEKDDPCGPSLAAQEFAAKMEPPPTFPDCAAPLQKRNAELAAQAKAQAPVKDVAVVHGGVAHGKQKRTRGQDGDKSTQPKGKAKTEPKGKAKAKAKGKAKAAGKRGRED